jgi:uncharacterized protein
MEPKAGGTEETTASGHLDLRAIEGARTDVHRRFSAGALTPDGGRQYRVPGVVALDVVVRKGGSDYRLSGRIEGDLELDCSRCLEPFRLEVGIDVDLLYLPASENRGDGEVRIEEEDLSTAFYRDEQIDLRHLVQEQFQLALPMKPLCRTDCRGLCIVCGGNRNAVACQCVDQWEDPRLAGLKQLLKH